MAQYYFGQIILAYVRDGTGRTKEHPALKTGSDEDCASGGPLRVLVISSKIHEPCPHYHIRVHHSFKTDPTTGLRLPCVAKCNWIEDVAHRRVLDRLGTMPDELLSPIMLKYNQLLDNESFVDWVDNDDD